MGGLEKEDFDGRRTRVSTHAGEAHEPHWIEVVGGWIRILVRLA